MIKEALKYIVDLGKANIIDVNGEQYSDKSLTRIIHNPKAKSIGMNTLTSLVDYIKANIDIMDDKMIVHVVDPTEVLLYSQLDLDRVRETVATVSAQIPSFEFGRFIDHESFCIALQSKFIDNEDRALVLKFAGTVEDGTVAQYGDDGITQKATVKTGIASKGDAVVPNPVKLKPYRTFQEIQQPESDFIFRMKSERGICCAVFEADGGAWKNDACMRIKDYLQGELAELPQFTVIS